MSGPLQIPKTSPVMVLPDCNFFPNTPLPLYIFEPRYRDMLAGVLDNERMFCIGTRLKPGCLAPVHDSDAEIYRFGTLGMVRACVKAEDGTSNLILEGVCRVEFGEMIHQTPICIAEIRAVPTSASVGEEKVEAARDKLAALIEAIVDQGGIENSPFQDPELMLEIDANLLVDLSAQYFVPDPHIRHVLLGMEDTFERLNFMIERLSNQLGVLGS